MIVTSRADKNVYLSIFEDFCALYLFQCNENFKFWKFKINYDQNYFPFSMATIGQENNSNDGNEERFKSFEWK